MAGGRAPGQFNSGGRVKGTPNKNTQDFIDLIETACPGFNPMVSMAKIAHLGTINSFLPDEAGNFRWVTERIGLEHRTKCLTEIAQYIAPKRKAVEHSGGIATSGGVLLVDKVATPEAWLNYTSAPIAAAVGSTE